MKKGNRFREIWLFFIFCTICSMCGRDCFNSVNHFRQRELDTSEHGFLSLILTRILDCAQLKRVDNVGPF